MQNIHKQYKRYYRDHFKASFSKTDVEKEHRWFYTQWRFINRKCEILSSYQVLEIGSGLGKIYTFLENKDRYWGIELDNDAVEFTNKYFKTDHFLDCSLEKYADKGNFDVVFAIEVLEHFASPAVNIEKIYKLLKLGGVFIGTTPYPFKKNVFADPTHNFVLHPENWKKLFLAAGFKTVELYPMSFIPSLWKINKKINPVIPIYFPFMNTIATCLIIARK